jgi:hypothetical protein
MRYSLPSADFGQSIGVGIFNEASMSWSTFTLGLAQSRSRKCEQIVAKYGGTNLLMPPLAGTADPMKVLVAGDVGERRVPADVAI